MVNEMKNVWVWINPVLNRTEDEPLYEVCVFSSEANLIDFLDKQKSNFDDSKTLCGKVALDYYNKQPRKKTIIIYEDGSHNIVDGHI